MTEDQDQKASPLLHCTVKKSRQVLGKVLKYGSYLVAGILIVFFIFCGLVAFYETILPALLVMWGEITANLTGVWQFLVAVPWYIYLGILGIAAIPVYSLLWCISRDLTEEDWKSNAAENLTLAPLTLAALGLAALTTTAIATLAPTLAPLTLGLTLAPLTLAALATLALAALAAFDNTSIWYYIFRFPGAMWHHYYKKGVR